MAREVSRSDCEKYRADLSGFVDETLPPKRWDQVGCHIAGCESCRGEVHELRKLRTVLGTTKVAAGAPVDLAQRLEGIAGDHSDAPLYMDPTSARGELPSARKARARRMRYTSVAVVSVVASVLVFAYLLAPTAPELDDPIETAREQYSMSVTALNVNESVGAVLLAATRGASLTQTDTAASKQSIFQQALEIDDDEVLALLQGMFAAENTYSGVQQVWLASESGGYLTSEVEINEVSGEGANLVVFDRVGGKFSSWFVPSNACCLSSVPSDWTFALASAQEQVAGRWADVLIAYDADGRKVAKWWIDTGNNMLLWFERYSESGEPSVVAGFTSLELGQATLDSSGSELVLMDSATVVQGSKDWCFGLPSCPTELGGLPLVAVSSSDSGRSERSIRLLYSDGVRNVSLTWSRNRLPDDQTMITDRTAGQPEVAVWQVSDGIISVATDGGLDLLNSVISELPEECDYDLELGQRIKAGLARLAGDQ